MRYEEFISLTLGKHETIMALHCIYTKYFFSFFFSRLIVIPNTIETDRTKIYTIQFLPVYSLVDSGA